MKDRPQETLAWHELPLSVQVLALPRPGDEYWLEGDAWMRRRPEWLGAPATAIETLHGPSISNPRYCWTLVGMEDE